MPIVKSDSTYTGDAFAFTARVDMGNLPTLPERLDTTFHEALIWHLADAAQRVIDTTRHYLVRLEEPAVMVGAGGKPIHGYDTGLMYVSLRYKLAEHLAATGVYYELLSDEAEYWRWVEFGHFMANGEFWQGYHMLETAIRANEGYIRSQVRAAWADTAQILAREAKVPGIVGKLLGA